MLVTSHSLKSPLIPTERDTVASLNGVGKAYGGVVALRDINFTLDKGETVALLGPNGAGKTTLINVLLGLRGIDCGTVSVFGDPPLSPRARQCIGVAQQDSGFPGTLRVSEIVAYVSAQYSRPAAEADLLERFGLTDVIRRQIGGLSGGQRRRLGVALAFAGSPQLVVLDEPTNGLDIESRRSVWAAIASCSEAGMTVLLTTHNLQEAEQLASRAVVVSKGIVLASDSVAAIRAGVGTRRISVTCARPLTGFANVSAVGDRYSFTSADTDAAVRELVLRDVPFRNLEIGAASLEDAFMLIVGNKI